MRTGTTFVPILSILRPKTAERFRRRLRQEGECLVFTGTKNARGYGFVDVTYKSKTERYPILTHRLAWALANGVDPPADRLVLHRCGNASCCNPKHLYLGTQQDNMNDKIAAGRHRSGMLGRKGTSHPRAHPQARRDEVIALLNERLAAGKGLNFLAVSRVAGVSRDTAARWYREYNPRWQ